MSRQYFEATSPTVGGPSCSYTTLSQYNTPSGIHLPRPVGSVGGYIVPSYGAPGYGTLQHGEATCSGYPDIEAAYGKSAGCCSQQYVRKLCQ